MNIGPEGSAADRGERPGRLLLLGAEAQNRAPAGYTATARGTVTICTTSDRPERCQLDWVLAQPPL